MAKLAPSSAMKEAELMLTEKVRAGFEVAPVLMTATSAAGTGKAPRFMRCRVESMPEQVHAQ